MKEQFKKRKKKINQLRKFNKYDIRELLWTSALVLYCYCGNNAKHGLLSKYLFQRKKQHGG